MGTVTLTTLRTLVRERADMVGSDFVADSATGVDRWINEGVSILQEKLIAAYGDEYAETTVSTTLEAMSTVNGAKEYSLPANFLKLYEVDHVVGDKVRAVKRYNRAERNLYKNGSLGIYDVGLRYKLSGSVIRFLPSSATGTIIFRYAPAATALVNGADTVTFPSTWERYVIAYAAMCMLAKEESSVAMLQGLLQKWDAELDQLAIDRDLSSPIQAVDVEAVDSTEWEYF